ncbi:MAG TPA: M23 family metallopeptidase [Nocardioidaceae bacterium]|nr:M23 family metallopeptidase [Nocardioidaceae bacterium]
MRRRTWPRAAARATTVALLWLLVLSATAVGAAAADDPAPRTWGWPLSPKPAVLSRFDLPASPWGPGHRGVDLLGRPRQPVLAVAAGRVTFAGMLAGRGVVVVSHGALRSTYEPVLASVTVGARVDAGERIGVLATTGSHCSPRACLHLGVLRGRKYVDPLTLLGGGPIRLKPLAGTGAPPSAEPGPGRAGAAAAAGSATGPAAPGSAPSRVLRALAGAGVGLLTAAGAAWLRRGRGTGQALG